MSSITFLLLLLLGSIAFIIFGTAYARLNAFFILLLAALGVGLLAGLPAQEVIGTVKSGFGHLLESIGIIVIEGTVLGVILEQTGATTRMADAILHRIGEKRAPLAITLTGFLVGLPIFCDSGFVVLSGLNRSLSERTETPMAIMSVCLATALYSVHCLVPPHPGIAAAAGLTATDPGLLMLVGTLVAIPGAAVGFFWARWVGGKAPRTRTPDYSAEQPASVSQNTSATRAFLPVAVPILLIAGKSLLGMSGPATSVSGKLIGFLGDPVVALLLGIALAITLVKDWNRTRINQLVSEGVDKAGPILAIVAAGGAFGAVLKATGIGQSIGAVLIPLNLGLFLPFLVTALLKTAQGSSTVAIITAASLLEPSFPALGLGSPEGRLLGTLAMGAGSMLLSHANDAFFWVITRFSDLDPLVTFRVYSSASVWMGLVCQGIICGLGWFLL